MNSKQNRLAEPGSASELKSEKEKRENAQAATAKREKGKAHVATAERESKDVRRMQRSVKALSMEAKPAKQVDQRVCTGHA